MSNLDVPGVYAIEHPPTRRAYIGQALNVAKRWARHRRDLRNGRHDNKPLQRAWTKYGEDAFTIRLLADFSHVPAAEVEALLVGSEIAEMARRSNLYNRARGGFGRPGISDKTRLELSERRKAMWADPAYRAKRKAAHDLAMANPDMQRRRGAAIKAAKSTPEFRAEQAERSRQMWTDPTFREKRGAAAAAAWTDEVRARHSEILKAAWARRKGAT